jgi:uncharacterized protein (TIRG00374 family)
MPQGKSLMGKGRQPGRALGSALRIGLSLVLLALVLQQVGWEQTWQSLQGAQLPYLAAALGLALAGMVVRAYRWKILLDALGLETSLSRLTVLYFIGMFFNNFLPTGFGGDVVRVYELAKHSVKPAEAVGTVLVDRATGLLVLFLMALLALPFSYRLVGPEVAAAIVILSVLGWGGAVLTLKRDWLERWGLLRLVAKIRRLEKVYESVYACGPKAAAGALLASLVYNVLLIAINYWIALSLGVRVSVWYFLAFVPIISFLLVLPISLSGLGLREGGYVYLFSQAGVSAPLALTMSLIVYAINIVTGSIGGVLYAIEGVRGLRAEVDE